MNLDQSLDRQINTRIAFLYARGTIPCALLGRKVRDTECCSRGLAATVEEFQTCRSCPEGQRLAATAPPWSHSMPLPAPVVYTPPPAGAHVRKTAPVFMGVDHGKPGGDKTVEVELAVGDKGAVALSFREIKPKAPRAKRQAKPVATCRKCGCTDNRACPGGCWWAEPDLCSACVNPDPVQVPVAQPAPPVIDPRLAKLASALRELTADGRMRVSMLDLMRSIGAANYDEAAGLVIHAGLRTSQLQGPVQTVLVDHTARLLMDSAASEVRQ